MALAILLEDLREAGAGECVTVLAVRAATQANIHSPMSVANLLRELHQADVDSAVATLAARAAEQFSLADPSAIGVMMIVLREAGIDSAAATLGTRASLAGIPGIVLDDPTSPWPGREADGTPSPAWVWQEPTR